MTCTYRAAADGANGTLPYYGMHIGSEERPFVNILIYYNVSGSRE